ncbi:MAG: hypothetical protein NVSMB27_49400 [Ktedonobacteraceae bacterium]
MAESTMTVRLNIPSDVPQQDVWDLEANLQHIDGVSTDLQESKDLLVATLLVLHVVASVAGPVATIGGGIKAIHDVARLLYDFLHQSGKSVTLTTSKGTQVSITHLSLEEIEQLLKGQ